MKRYFSLVIFLALGAILTQGFQCAPPELTSAKVNMSDKVRDYPKAKEQLEKVLAKNPNNEEALILLAQVYQLLGDLPATAKTISQAEKVVVDPKYKAQVIEYKSQLWRNLYNRSIFYYNRYGTGKDKNLLDSAVMYLDLAISVRPATEEFFFFKGMILETKGDTARATSSYEKYTDLFIEELDLAKKYSFYIDINRDDALLRLKQKPTFSKGFKQSPESDSLITDLINLDGKELYLYSAKKKNETAKVAGWRINPPKDWVESEKWDFYPINTQPFAALSQIYYTKKDYGKSMKFLKELQILEPGNEQANAFMIQLYQEDGKPDEALKEIAQIAKDNPDNKLYWLRYGDILLTMNKFDEAIEQYERAIKIDPRYDYALRNAASAYKNKAGEIQKKEQELLDKDRNYKQKTELYFPILKKSAQYFEECRKSDKFKNDIEVLAELFNIDAVLDDQAKLKSLMRELEQLEFSTDNPERYFQIMCKVYTETKMTDKAKVACEKYQELLNKGQ